MIDALIIDCSTNEGPLLLVTLRIICSMVCIVDASLASEIHHFVSLLCKDESCFFYVVVTPKRAGLNGAF